jgi:hypothetical protein
LAQWFKETAMRRGTRDAAWGLLVLITAMGCASASPAQAGAVPGSHDGYAGAFNNGYWGDDGAQAKELIQEPG